MFGDVRPLRGVARDASSAMVGGPDNFNTPFLTLAYSVASMSPLLSNCAMYVTTRGIISVRLSPQLCATAAMWLKDFSRSELFALSNMKAHSEQIGVNKKLTFEATDLEKSLT